MAEASTTITYQRIADVIRSAQRAAIETENAPEERKRLRTFSILETVKLLKITQKELMGCARKHGLGPVQGRFKFESINFLREAILKEDPGVNVSARRDITKGEHLATVVFSNFKGGSAKTTSSVHFAQYAALAGYRVLIVDLDSQGSTTAQFGIDPALEVGNKNSFAAWTEAREEKAPIVAASICQRTYWPSIDIVPAGAVLASAEDSLSKRGAAGVRESVLYFDELKVFLKEVESDYDIAVIDTRPDVNMLMTIALHAATGLIVPTRATMTDLASTGEFFAHLASYINDFETTLGTKLGPQFTRIMITAYDPTDRSQEAIADLVRDRFENAVLPGEFLHSRIVGTASFGKETLYEYEPTTDRAAYNRIITSVNAVNRAIENDIWRTWGRPNND